MKYQARHLIEYGLLRAVSGVLSRVPYRLALGLAWCIAVLLYAVGRRRVREAERRIREVFGSALDERGVRRAAWRSLRNLSFNVVEIIRLPRLTRAWVERHMDRGNLPALMARHVAPGQGAILVIPHMGNWDLAGVGATLTGVPVFVVAARQRNPLTDAFLTRMRASGMPISDLRHYVALVDAGQHTVPERLDALLEHRDTLRAQIAQLQLSLAATEYKLATCQDGPRP